MGAATDCRGPKWGLQLGICGGFQSLGVKTTSRKPTINRLILNPVHTDREGKYSSYHGIGSRKRDFIILRYHFECQFLASL